MDRLGLLATLAMAAIATTVGGAAVRVVALLTVRPATATLALLAVYLIVALVAVVRLRPRGTTPYWG